MKKLLFLFFIMPLLGLGQTQIHQQILGTPNNYYFETSIALSHDGNTVVISTPGLGAPSGASGYIEVYEISNDLWTPVSSAIHGGYNGDLFGESVALSSDGSIIAVGAPGSQYTQSYAGLVRVYKNENGTLTQLGSDVIGNNQIYSKFGSSVSLSDDGNTLAIGAIDAFPGGGIVSVYRLVNNDWTLIGQNINDLDTYYDANFGASVALSSDGSKIAIGATKGNFSEAGYVVVFENINDTWVQVGDLINGDSIGDQFGREISISSDGTIIAIGAPYNDDNQTASGHVKVFENINNTWTQIGNTIIGDNLQSNCGSGVALSSDGSILAIGSEGNWDPTPSTQGLIRIYKNINNDWIQVGNDIFGQSNASEFGASVGINQNGEKIVVGAPRYYDGTNLIGHVLTFSYASELALLEVVDDIFGNSNGDNISARQLNNIEGVSGAIDGVNYTTALQNATYADPYNPTAAEIQAVIDAVNDSLSLEENSLSVFKLYPNPAKNQFTIQFTTSLSLEKVTIYNTLGQEVLTSKNTIVDTSTLTSGSYIVEITTNNGKASKNLIIE